MTCYQGQQKNFAKTFLDCFFFINLIMLMLLRRIQYVVYPLICTLYICYYCMIYIYFGEFLNTRGKLEGKLQSIQKIHNNIFYLSGDALIAAELN